MPDYVYPLVCPNCGATVDVPFGRRADDVATVLWRHDGCPDADVSRRLTDYISTSLPTDENGDLIPPEGA